MEPDNIINEQYEETAAVEDSDKTTPQPPDNKVMSDNKDNNSEGSSISEHISSINSFENDRSFQEIEIGNVTTDLTNLLKSHPSEVLNISQENRPSLNSISFPSEESNFSHSAVKNVQSILDEILHNEQFHSDNDSCDGSFNIFEGVNLDDNSINNYVTHLKDDSLTKVNQDDVKVDPGPLLSNLDYNIKVSDVNMDSLKEMPSNQSTYSMNLSNMTLTEYKQFQEECTNKIIEYKNALAIRDEMILSLKESLEKSIVDKELTQGICEKLNEDIQFLQKELTETTEYIKLHQCTKLENVDKNKIAHLEDICSDFDQDLKTDQVVKFNDLKLKINEYMLITNKEYEDEFKNLKESLDQERSKHNLEITRLRELLSSVQSGNPDISILQEEIRVKFVQEMEEVRNYCEKKCADMEKHYSDEIFSQQSRKMSDSSIGSEADLASDLIFTPQIGPGGDTGSPIYKPNTGNLSKQDLLTLKSQMEKFVKMADIVNEDNLSDVDFIRLKEALLGINLKSLFKTDLQSKYNAELEILREDYENQIDLLNLENQRKVEDLEKVYEEQIEGLKIELEEAKEINVNAMQDVANSGEYELVDIVKSYQVRLQEQVTLAKHDIVSALVDQIQILCDNACDDSEWPEEFLQIKEKLSEKYVLEIETLKQSHTEEVGKMKEEHLKLLNGTLERARRRSIKEGETSIDIDIIKERKTSNMLRNLISELVNYFTQCEDEINTTLVEELIKLSDIDSESINNSSNTDTMIESNKRVHLLPNLSKLKIPENYSSRDSSLEFKSELDMCLVRLKAEANDVLKLSMSFKDRQDVGKVEDHNKSLEDKVSSLTRRLICDSHAKEDLNAQLEEAQEFARTLEIERDDYDKQIGELIEKNQVLEQELGKTRNKINELIECGRKETIAEGYGENSMIVGGSVSRTTFNELQEKARNLTAKSTFDSSNPWLQLVDELCREGDRLIEFEKNNRTDFVQQIEAADKKLKETTHFLEVQAVEREQERDEAQKDIAILREQLRERDKDRSYYERVNKEVEQLENQMRDMSKLIEDQDLKYTELEKEKTEAVDKIFDLRDLIRELESQIEAKTATESELKDIISKLEDIIRQQREANDELSAELESGENIICLQKHIDNLEEEVQKLRLTNELAGNEAVLKQIQIQLHDIELTIDKSTRDLENLYNTISGTSCSSPSEEMSIRDQIRPVTPNSTQDECEVPLQQLARLKEKLIKHSRAEHATIKKIQDLEMQLISAKHDYDELQSERDVLQEQVSEQHVLISSLQIRLDDQRLRAENIQKQTNASLEVRIYDLENDLQNLRDILHTKESTIKQLNKVIEQLNQRLQDRERELSSNIDEHVIKELQEEIMKVKSENQLLSAKIESDAQNAQVLPGLVDNIIADKNREMDNLRQKLSDMEKQLDTYITLNSEKSAEERGAISFINYTTPELLRHALNRSSSLEISEAEIFPIKDNLEPEISRIEKIGPSNINYTVDAPLVKSNSTEIYKSSDKHVHFDDSETKQEKDVSPTKSISQNVLENELKQLKVNLAEAKMHVMEKEMALEELKDDSKRKDDMYFKLAQEKRDIEKMVLERNEDIENLNSKIHFVNNEYDELNLKMKKTEVINEELKIIEEQFRKDLFEKNKEMILKDDLNLKLTKDLENLRNQFDEVNRKIRENVFQSEQDHQKLKNCIIDKEKEIECFETKVTSQAVKIEQFEVLIATKESEIKILKDKVNKYQNDLEILEVKMSKLTQESDQLKFVKQRKEIAQKDLEIVKLKSTNGDLNNDVKQLQTQLDEKAETITQIKSDCEALRANLAIITAKFNESHDFQHKLQKERLRADCSTPIDLISNQVQQQLDYSSQIDASSSLDSINDIEILKSTINKEHNKNLELIKNKQKLELQLKILENNLSDSRDSLIELQAVLENERKACHEIRIQDNKLIEQLRIKLEYQLQNEIEFEKIFTQEKQKREELEKEIVNVQRKYLDNLSLPSSKTEYKSLQLIDPVKKQLEAAIEEIAVLKKDLKGAKKSKVEVEARFKYTKDLLNLKCLEIEAVQKSNKELNEEVITFKEKIVGVNFELEQRTREVENSRILLNDFDQEKMQLKLRINYFHDKVKQLEDANTNERSLLDRNIPEQFVMKMKDLSDLLTDYKKDNQVMSETIVKLTAEINRLKSEVENIDSDNNLNLPFNNPAARAEHLFKKYLQAESYRKALTYQKHYFIKLINSYQENFVIDHGIRKKAVIKKKSFRSIVIVIISIHRMKYMVTRWKYGSRGETILAIRKQFNNLHKVGNTTNFMINQPVSSQNFNNFGYKRGSVVGQFSTYDVPGVNTPIGNELINPWSGMSPPSKDKNVLHEKVASSSSIGRELPDFSKYIERFSIIQHSLGLSNRSDT